MENETEKNIGKICNIKYLTEMVGGKKHLIKELMEAFILQINEELLSINEAIPKSDFEKIRKITHTMKSSVSVMGITVLTSDLQEMEDLGKLAMDIERIKELNIKLNSVCKQAIEEVEKEKKNYE